MTEQPSVLESFLSEVSEREGKATKGPWRSVVKSVGRCEYSFGMGEDCTGGHPVYSEFIEPLGFQMHGGDFDQSHATEKKGPPPSSADARLIAAARQDIPKLLALVKEAKAALEIDAAEGHDDDSEHSVRARRALDRMSEIVRVNAEGLKGEGR